MSTPHAGCSLPVLRTPHSALRTQMVRLQKFLAEAGVASRRAGEQMILAGRVAVNGADGAGAGRAD